MPDIQRLTPAGSPSRANEKVIHNRIPSPWQEGVSVVPYGMKTESIFQVTHKLTPKATILRKDFVKAFDVAHATRIANRLFRIVEKVEDLDMARWAADQS